MSRNHKTEAGKWYDQDKNEFVLILKGNAELKFENNLIKMKEGDYIVIPAYTRHKVEKTAKETVWLAVFY